MDKKLGFPYVIPLITSLYLPIPINQKNTMVYRLLSLNVRGKVFPRRALKENMEFGLEIRGKYFLKISKFQKKIGSEKKAKVLKLPWHHSTTDVRSEEHTSELQS